MAGFLSSLFGKKKNPEVMKTPEPPSFKGDLVALGVTEEKAIYFADRLRNEDVTDGLTINATSDFPNLDIATKAVNRILPELEGKTFNALHFRGINTAQMTDLKLFQNGFPNIKANQISFIGCTLNSEEMNGAFKALPTLETSQFILRNTSLNQENATVLAQVLAQKTLNVLWIKDSAVEEGGILALTRGIEKSNLHTLELSLSEHGKDDASNLIKALPVGIKRFNLHRAPMKKTDIDMLIKRFDSFEKLDALCLIHCGVSDKESTQIVRHLPSSVTNFQIPDEKVSKNETAQALLDVMTLPESNLRLVHIGDLKEEFGGKLSLSLLQAGAKNDKRYWDKVHAQKASEIFEIKTTSLSSRISSSQTPEETKSLLREALVKKRCDQVLAKLKEQGGSFSALEMSEKENDGKTLIECISNACKIPNVVNSTFFKNANDFQDVLKMLNTSDKAFFDGRGGHPSVQKIKNEIMANTVKTTLMHKNAKINGKG